MSDFNCERCGVVCFDTQIGYISGCIHYPPDNIPGALITCDCGDSYPINSDDGQKILEYDRCINCQMMNGK